MKAIRFVAHKLKQRILESEDFATLISLILIPGISGNARKTVILW